MAHASAQKYAHCTIRDQSCKINAYQSHASPHSGSVCMAKMACSGGDNISQQTYLALAVFMVISTMLELELKRPMPT